MNEKELSEILSELDIEQCVGHFMFPDEVAERCRDLRGVNGVTVSEIGSSKSGKYPLFGISLGADEDKAEKVIMVCANMHAEEVTGTISTMLLAEELAHNSVLRPLLKNRFLFVPQANPDGVMHNKEWMKPDFNYESFVLNAYRDLPEDDIEWGFPVENKTVRRPEAKAIKAFFDQQSRVDYYVSLHSGFSIPGLLFLLNGQENQNEKIINFLTDFSLNIDEKIGLLEEDPAGQMGWKRIEKGFFNIPSYEDLKKFIELSGDKELINTLMLNSVQYVEQNLGAKFAMVSELPFVWADALNGDEHLDISRYETEKQAVGYGKKSVALFQKMIEEISDFSFNDEAQFWFNYAKMYLKLEQTLVKSAKKDLDRFKGIKAYRKDLLELYLSKYRIEFRIAAYAIKILRHCNDVRSNELLNKYIKIFDENFAKYEKHLNSQVLPISAQVKLQVGMILSGLLL